MVCQATNGREAEDVRDGNRPLELLLEAAVRLDRQQRMPAQVEEVLGRPDAGNVEYLPPYAGNAFRSTLAFGVSGRAVRTTMCDGIMCSGSSSRSAPRRDAGERTVPALAVT